MKKFKYVIVTPRMNNGGCLALHTLCRYLHDLGEDAKVELRFPDPAANPYLAIAICIAAGIEGIDKQIDPGTAAPMCYENDVEIKKLPATLREAIYAFKEDKFMEEVLGKLFIDIYSDLKLSEWNEYMDNLRV